MKVMLDTNILLSAALFPNGAAAKRLIGRVELYNRIAEGLEEINSGSTRLYSDAIAEIRSSRKER